MAAGVEALDRNAGKKTEKLLQDRNDTCSVLEVQPAFQRVQDSCSKRSKRVVAALSTCLEVLRHARGSPETDNQARQQVAHLPRKASAAQGSQREHLVPEAARASTPFFVGPDGFTAVDTNVGVVRVGVLFPKATALIIEQ